MGRKRTEQRSESRELSRVVERRVKAIEACQCRDLTVKAYADRTGQSVYTLYEAMRQARRAGVVPPHRSTKRQKKKRASESRGPLPIPQAPGDLWKMDFMSDRLGSGRVNRPFNVVDVCSRTCVGTAVDHLFPASRVTAYLGAWIAEHGKPSAIQGDNGTEFTANAFDAWAYERGIAVHFITPGKPVENAVIESFDGKLRDA